MKLKFGRNGLANTVNRFRLAKEVNPLPDLKKYPKQHLPVFNKANFKRYVQNKEENFGG